MNYSLRNSRSSCQGLTPDPLKEMILSLKIVLLLSLGLTSFASEEAHTDLHRVLTLSETIPFSWKVEHDGKGFVYRVDINDHIMKEMSLKLNLSDDESREIKKFAEFLIEFHLDVGKPLTHFELLESLENEGGRRLFDEELREREALEERKERMEREMY